METKEILSLIAICVSIVSLIVTYIEKKKNSEFRARHEISLEKIKLDIPAFLGKKAELLELHILPIANLLDSCGTIPILSEKTKSIYLDDLQELSTKLREFRIKNDSVISFDSVVIKNLELVDNGLIEMLDALESGADLSTCAAKIYGAIDKIKLGGEA